MAPLLGGDGRTSLEVVLAVWVLIDLWATLGDRPFSWFTAKTTGEALVRNSYIHPRRHLAEHYLERGDKSRGTELREETMAELHRVGAPESVTSVWS